MLLLSNRSSPEGPKDPHLGLRGIDHSHLYNPRTSAAAPGSCSTSMAATPHKSLPSWLEGHPSEAALYQNAITALQEQMLALGAPCSGSTCACQRISSLAQQVCQAAASILQGLAVCRPDTAAATPEEEQQSRLQAQLQLQDMGELRHHLPCLSAQLLAGQHSPDALCSMADAFNRWDLGSCGGQRSCTQVLLLCKCRHSRNCSTSVLHRQGPICIYMHAGYRRLRRDPISALPLSTTLLQQVHKCRMAQLFLPALLASSLCCMHYIKPCQHTPSPWRSLPACNQATLLKSGVETVGMCLM